ncbi:hypothetical protein SETIT_6G174800v2 [Setaria italica]|uniref:O-methyltransferase domain-containing protein n=1 Tax=Setaria italica TaxID=4555 RepID=K3YI88_SETIT|nr:acetylserotonin O-methyltransferase 3 [Setaria italica]RCV31410.1 hypothetical protein SETIT_6G174800v2 [Setaria italica]
MSRVQEELSTQDMLRGYVEIHHLGLCHVKSMAFWCAIQLGIPSAIHRRGGAATLSDLVTETGVDPSKLPYLRRLMRVLTVSGIFAADQPASPVDYESETIYMLTPASRLLADGGASTTSCDISPMVRLLVRPTTTVSTYFNLEEWLKDDGTASLFEVVHGMTPWMMTKNDVAYNKVLNEACAADSNFAMDTILKDPGLASIFSGLSSLVDVGGGHGAAAVAIARAFPHIQCSVLDLEQVVSEAPADGTVQFISGDMFESVPPADGVLLKFVLHCWDDDSSVKILRQCKKAISARDAGGKVIIMNMVVGYETPDKIAKEAQVLWDMFMMRHVGVEREEHEWKRIFLEAGFSDYKITPTLGFQSIIEVFP